MTRSTCGSCGARVLWVRHIDTGKPAPLDPSPTSVGNVVLTVDGERYKVLTLDEERELAHDAARYVLHFVTCPNAKAHRRPR